MVRSHRPLLLASLAIFLAVALVAPGAQAGHRFPGACDVGAKNEPVCLQDISNRESADCDAPGSYVGFFGVESHPRDDVFVTASWVEACQGGASPFVENRLFASVSLFDSTFGASVYNTDYENQAAKCRVYAFVDDDSVQSDTFVPCPVAPPAIVTGVVGHVLP